MKILLVSDTHGHINRITEYAICANADICIHAGDFGFYDEQSVAALSQRELYLQIKHSDLPDSQRMELLKANASGWKAAITEHRLLGDFTEYLDGARKFDLPVYAVWGNHDDAEVVLRMIKDSVGNLHILHDKAFVDLGDFIILGLGGNCTPQKAFTQGYKGLPGARCRPASVLSQYLSLLKTSCAVASGKPKILVTHVSPLVEPFLELFAWQIGAAITVSGHMGYSDGETGITDSRNFSRLLETYRKLRQSYPEAGEELKRLEPRQKEWSIRHINLPDAKVGYAVLDWDGLKFTCEMRGKTFLENCGRSSGDGRA